MNIERMNTVADILDSKQRLDGTGWFFRFSFVTNECGTAGCTAGLIGLLWGEHLLNRRSSVLAEYGALVGLDFDQSVRLFEPVSVYEDDSICPPEIDDSDFYTAAALLRPSVSWWPVTATPG